MASNPPSYPNSGTATPTSQGRFSAQAMSTEDVLKAQTVGLVNLADFRKRRADALDSAHREQSKGSENGDGALTPKSTADGGDSDVAPGFKKKKVKKGKRGLLSFDEDEGNEYGSSARQEASTKSENSIKSSGDQKPESIETSTRKLTPNPNAKVPAPKVKTKASLAAEAAERERLRKEFLELQEKVRNTEISIPFVFHDGNNIPGGKVKVKKGDHIWLLLERCRKIGAETGVSGTGSSGGGHDFKKRDDSRRQWARVGVDDLMCVRGEIIIPHHYDFYYFIVNKVTDPARTGRLLFDYSGNIASTEDEEETSLIRIPGKEPLEGADDDPTYTKVVDRRWYEKNKHIYPASMWKEYKAGTEFEQLARARKDAEGNSFFFS